MLKDIGLYLPKYLTPESQKELLAELQSFPDNIDKRFYAPLLANEGGLLQGDGLENLIVVKIPDLQLKHVPCMVVSNSCDNDLGNKRIFPAHILYSPIVEIDKLEALILSALGPDGNSRVDDIMRDIRKQRITNIFYLPCGPGVPKESVVFFDHITNVPRVSIDPITSKRIFTLSNYAYYMLLLKLSIHFCRFQEGIDRSSLSTPPSGDTPGCPA